MSSLTRRMQRRLPRQRAAADRRRALRKGETVEREEQDRPFRSLAGGAIEVLRPTRGWLRTSAARVALYAAQAKARVDFLRSIGSL